MKTGFLARLAVALALAGSAPAQTTPSEGSFVVFFSLNRAAIRPDMAGILDNAAATFLQGGTGICCGTRDRDGSAAYNMSLVPAADRRVRAYLAAVGVPVGDRYRRLGEQRPGRHPRRNREPQNRRVEITFGPHPTM